MDRRTPAQQDLFDQCSDMLENPTSGGISNTLNQITDEKVRASTGTAIKVGTQQLSNIGSRLAALRSGAAGIGLQGLSFNIDGESISANQLASLAASGLSGGGAGDGSNMTFGKLGFFLTGTFNFGDKDTTDNETGSDFDTQGITGGADYRFTDKLIAGGAIGYAKNNIDFDANGGGLDTDTWHLAAYGTFYWNERTYIDAIVEYGWHDYDSQRNIQYQVASDLGPVRRQATSDYDGTQFGASLGAGYDFDNEGPLSYGVYGRVGYIQVDVDGFREEGAGGLSLKLNDFDATSVTTTLGGRVFRVFNTTKAVIIPVLRFEWEHEYDNDATKLVAQFAADPTGSSFSILTDSPDRDYFRLGLGASAVFTHGMSAFVNYDTVLNKSDWTDHLIDGGVRWEFD